MLVSILIWVLFGLAVVLPVADLPNMSEPSERDRIVYGHEALSELWDRQAPAGPGPQYANIALLFGWIAFLCRWKNVSIAFGGAAVGLAISAPIFYRIDVPLLRIGYYLWLGSCVLLLIASGTIATKTEGAD